MPIREGEPAPPFALHGAGGETVRLDAMRGRDVIIYFYPKDDTPGCTKEACGFRDLWQDLEGAGAVVLGVSPDDGVSHRRFSERYSLPFTLLSDPDKTVMAAYGAWGEKVLYGKKTVGVIRSTVWIGPDGKVRKHWARVANAEKHPQNVLEAVRGGRTDR